ncbi:MAG: xanthine dehydrogenase family protein subunit M [Novosphingobium sp.]|nr:xanthine dehydrogenase family protein subunit M [Novosphingobium sp.]
MKPAPFDYVGATSIDDAVAQLASGDATVIAGGQTLMPLLALRMSMPLTVVDINRVADLRGVSVSDQGVRIGAMTRQADLLTDAALAGALPPLVTAVRHVGHHQTRNRGTIGGSLVFAEPAAEMPATAVALGATLELRSAGGTRNVAAETFYLGPYMTDIVPDELLVAVTFPAWPRHARTVFREVAQRPGDFALVGLVGAVEIEGGAIARAGLAWFGMGPTPMRARQAESALVGRAPGDIRASEIAELAIADTDPFDDVHATAEYRREVGRRVFAQALTAALAQEGQA